MMRAGLARPAAKPDLKQAAAQKRRPVTRIVSVSMFEDDFAWLTQAADLLQKAGGGLSMKSAIVRVALQLAQRHMTASDPDELLKQFNTLRRSSS